ncbi:MAG: ATP-binding protein, partial [Candidatus Doudnabacteria bacterium]|nr:ATP-binding protein [Candidatus Doudnabacteria bacterium]
RGFAKYDAVTVSFDDNVTYLVGKNGAGKSTLGITAIWFMFCGIAEKSSGGTNPLIGERFRFIGPKAATAKGEMILHDEKTGIDIKVMRKLTKSGSDLSFEPPEGYELGQQWLTDLFNIFLIAPKKFCDLSAKDQAKALGIDTKKFDQRIAELKKDYTESNAVYRSFGDLPEVEKVDKVDVAALQAQKKEIADKLNSLYLENKKTNEATKKAWESSCDAIDKECSEFNNKQIVLQNTIEQATKLYSQLEGLGYKGYEVSDWIKSLGKPEETKNSEPLYPAEPTYIPELPDRAELDAIDQQIIAAGETNNNALLYEQFVEKKTKKGVYETALKTNKDKQAATEAERLEYIKSFKFPFSNLSVGEDGELLLNGKPIKAEYFSTGELLKIIPVLIATTQPELKYVFLQDFNLMDEDKQKEIEEYLTGKGFQLVVEMVGKAKVADKNCILLRDNVVVDSYKESTKEEIAV